MTKDKIKYFINLNGNKIYFSTVSLSEVNNLKPKFIKPLYK
jgi:hypothetical protein